ncbi:MAG TPA: beta-ketoacyl-ACP synthase III [Armatimonadota bacterium]|nr:beta-ketoacyl-ACP synthase III [Armatimonadota bacterium]
MSAPIRPVGISGVGFHVPPRVLTNFDLEKSVDTTDEWIRTRTGIIERRIAEPEVATSDLGLEAARAALERAHLDPRELDLIIVATITPDMAFPATACLVQHRLGAERAGAFDLQAGCTGFVYALSLASQVIATGACDNVLIIGAEVLSRIVDWNDRATCVIFGDGAGAALLQPTTQGRGVLAFALRADGSGSEALKLPAGGSRLPTTAETVARGLHYTYMDGQEVFRFALRAVEEVTLECLRRAGLTLAQVDLIIPHQANSRIIEACAKRLDFPEDHWVCNVDRYGNTSAASIPIALAESVESGRLREGMVVVLVGFGAGLTHGAVVIRW